MKKGIKAALLSLATLSSISLSGCNFNNNSTEQQEKKEQTNNWLICSQKNNILYNIKQYYYRLDGGYIEFTPTGTENKINFNGDWYLFKIKPDSMLYDFEYDGYTNTYIPAVEQSLEN